MQTPLGRRLAAGTAAIVARAEIELAQDFTTECARYLSCRANASGSQASRIPKRRWPSCRSRAPTLEPLQILQLERLISVGIGSARAVPRRQSPANSIRSCPGSRAESPTCGGCSAPSRARSCRGAKSTKTPAPSSGPFGASWARPARASSGAWTPSSRRRRRAVQDDLVTFRNGRFVIPIRTDSRDQVPGVVHGLSSSGQTTFVEPLAVIEQNNELVRLREQEEIEISRILLSITRGPPGPPARDIAVVRDTVALVDFAQAKGGFPPSSAACGRALAGGTDAAPRRRAACPARARAARHPGRPLSRSPSSSTTPTGWSSSAGRTPAARRWC